MFYTQYRRPEKQPEVLGGEVLVEKEGYVPAKEQIEGMFLAGRRLVAGRGYFEFPPEGEIPDDYDDPTRDPNFDMADASQMRQNLLTKSAKVVENEEDESVNEPAVVGDGKETPKEP